MHRIDIYIKPGHECVTVPPPCSTCSSGGTCAGCDPEERRADKVASDFNEYYDRLGRCRVHLLAEETTKAVAEGLALVFDGYETIFEVTETTVWQVLDHYSPVVAVDDRLLSTNTLPSALGLKKML